MRSNRNVKSRKWIYIVLFAFIIIIGFYLYKAMSYESRFLPKTSVNQVDIGNLTVKEANQKLVKTFDVQDFKINDHEKEWKSISKKDLGVKTEFTEDLKKDLKKQNVWSWPASYLHKWKNITINNTQLDEENLSKFLNEKVKPELDQLNAQREPTKNATIAKTDNGFEIVPEQIGTAIDTNRVLEELGTKIKEGQNTLELEQYVQQPTLTANSPEITANLEKIKKVTDVPYTYIINGQSVAIPKENITSWVSFDGQNVSVDSNAVRDYVATLGQTYNTSQVSTSFKSTRRGDVSVPPGTYSWTIQVDSEADQLTKDILSGNGMNRTPITQGSATPDHSLVGGTYIEVDLQNQHMWYYKDGALQLETDIVSGKPSTPTPTGVFYVWNRERNATLVGENYRTPVAYWMPIDWTGVGIHDSNWQPAYGGNLWQTVGSHGCVNTPPGVMAQLFEMTATGTPVIVF